MKPTSTFYKEHTFIWSSAKLEEISFLVYVVDVCDSHSQDPDKYFHEWKRNNQENPRGHKKITNEFNKMQKNIIGLKKTKRLRLRWCVLRLDSFNFHNHFNPITQLNLHEVRGEKKLTTVIGRNTSKRCGIEA